MSAQDISKTKINKSQGKYWIYKTEYYCPQCGRSEEFRERRYDPKPKKWGERNEEHERWDYCGI